MLRNRWAQKGGGGPFAEGRQNLRPERWWYCYRDALQEIGNVFAI